MPTRITRRRFPLKLLYIRLLLWVLGRTIPAASRLSPAVREEAAAFPEGFTILLGIWPSGPDMQLAADGRGGLVHAAGNTKQPDLTVRLKSLEAAFRLFTFRESTAGSEAGGRLIVAGSLPQVLSFIRIIDAVEILLLPGFLARRAVKQLERPEGLMRHRMGLYLSLILPGRKGAPA